MSLSASLRSAQYQLAFSQDGRFYIGRKEPDSDVFQEWMNLGGDFTMGAKLVSDLNELERLRNRRKWWQRRG